MDLVRLAIQHSKESLRFCGKEQGLRDEEKKQRILHTGHEREQPSHKREEADDCGKTVGTGCHTCVQHHNVADNSS